MFTILFAAIGELIFWGGLAYIGYRIIFRKSIAEKKEFKQKMKDVEKLSLVILKSNSSEEISFFMKNNVSFLSRETFDKLNEHLDFVNVMSEAPLKARFENLPHIEELDYEGRNPVDVVFDPPTLQK